jgi:hypothetical protein
MRTLQQSKNVSENRTNSLVDFAFWLDSMSDVLYHRYKDGKGKEDDASKFVASIRDEYKSMLTKRINNLTQKSLVNHKHLNIK